MASWVIALIVVAAVIAVVAIVAVAVRGRRNAALRSRFGPEYDRTIERAGGKRAATKELRDRQNRHDELQLQPLSPMAAERFRTQWRLVQERFVDAPAESVEAAHRLLRDALEARGYPTRDGDERMAMLSVDHADVLDRYRQGMSTERRWRERGNADTEDLRVAMQHYRSVFERIVGEEAAPDRSPDGAYPAETTTSTPDADVAAPPRSAQQRGRR